MTIAIIVGVVLGLLWFIAQHYGGAKVDTSVAIRGRSGERSRRIHTDDIPATWQGLPISERYRQQIIDADEEIPF